MKVSKRQRFILEKLMGQEEELTVAEIAKDIQVSSRTVHRELMELETFLETLGITLVKKTGSGIRLQADQASLKRLREELQQADPSEYTADERKVLILCTLLEEEEPVKLFALSHELQAAIPTISNDLDDIERILERSGLTLIRKRGYGVEIEGPEEVKRTCISLLVQTHLDDSMLFGTLNQPPADAMTRRLLDLMGKDRIFEVEKALWKLEERYPASLPQAAYNRLLIRLTVGLSRYARGKRVEAGDPSVDWTPEETDRSRFAFFEQNLQLELPPEEKRYLMGLLREWEKDRSQGIFPHDDIRHLEFVNRLIRMVEERLGVDLMQDPSLKGGLLQHVVPVMERLARGETIRNPLLTQIKKDYEHLFGIVKSVVAGMMLNEKLPDEEIGYLVIHFGAALERIRQFSRRVKALLVCTNGIGSSKLLAVRIGKEFPQIELLGHVSWFEALRIPPEEYDLIISTVDLPLPADQYIKLSPLLTADEAERLRRFIQGMSLRILPEQEEGPAREPLELLRSVRIYSQEIVRIIEGFRVHPLTAPRSAGLTDLRVIVADLCRTVKQEHGMEQVYEVAEKLLAREKQSSQIIPHSGLALFHTRGDSVEHPILALFRYDRPIQWAGLNGDRVQHILLMLGPTVMEKETLEVLSEVSAMLLEPEVILRLELEDEASIKQFFSNRFEQFIKTKLDWREWK